MVFIAYRSRQKKLVLLLVPVQTNEERLLIYGFFCFFFFFLIKIRIMVPQLNCKTWATFSYASVVLGFMRNRTSYGFNPS